MTNHWYAHYPGDYLRDTGHLSLVQHGAYRVLLDHCYMTGAPLPADSPSLYRICRAFDEAERNAVDFVLGQFFQLRDDGYHNARADREIEKQAEHHKRLSNAGKKAMRNRWGVDNQATSQVSNPAITNPHPHPQPHKALKSIPSAKPAEDAPSREFEAFWDAFPKKLDKQSAKRAWVKNFCEGNLAEILDSLEAWKATSQWADAKFIPYASTWLNKGRHKEIPPREINTNGNPGAVKPAAGKYDNLKTIRITA